MFENAWSLTKGESFSENDDWLVLLIQIIRTAFLPPIVYWTLLLDTWYWRGVPRRKKLNQRALVATNSSFTHPEAAGGLGRWLAQPRYPPGDPANDRLQQLLDDSSELIIDHAFLDIDYDVLLGRGASASVFHGRLTLLYGGAAAGFIPGFSASGSALFAADPKETRARSVEVAVKIHTPPELDEDAILSIKEETKAWGELSKLAFQYQQSSFASSVINENEQELVILKKRPPNLVRFFGMCVMPPHLSLVFEYCEGGSLYEWISLSSPPPKFIQRKKIILDCSLAVHFLHVHGYIHRDIKSANFLLKNGVALLTDFGTCVSREDKNFNSIFIGGTTVGTTDHMAPELLIENPDSGREYSFASDIYALSVVVGSVLSFRDPFPNLRDWDIRQRVLNGETPYDLDDFVFQHDLKIKSWILRSFSRNPSDRPSVIQLIEIFEEDQASSDDIGIHHRCFGNELDELT